MSRSVPEWIGKTPDTPVPPRVKLRVFEAHGGRCYLSGRKITAADKWELEHVLALSLGGENRESNLAPALKSEHKKKTARDVAQKAKNARVRKKHLGLREAKNPIAGSRNTRFKKKIGGGVVDRNTGEEI
ncbi:MULTISPECIES: HNH endonuclease [Halocynthiibacter]|uniref:HNH endonuclease n=1 Tax=Halocynthiibacter halioticoli TaxID=2986804 RepID=A0AAE3LTY9_9RHOB|nr:MULTISPECIES: HNH endonuclease signature motif containing protein [Halocynthiibacter]MCV6826031.1 HNH endonuclease [Halocynthiibacter halioticoli]MCW4059032.1 HNH endonuclease [Halocynthiibacter sp. SDUM655004]